jgi:hypothetical protein
MKARIDEIGPDLEGLDHEAAPAKGFQQAQRDGSLADATGDAGDDEYPG